MTKTEGYDPSHGLRTGEARRVSESRFRTPGPRPPTGPIAEQRLCNVEGLPEQLFGGSPLPLEPSFVLRTLTLTPFYTALLSLGYSILNMRQVESLYALEKVRQQIRGLQNYQQ